jgi:hypothetical protein
MLLEGGLVGGGAVAFVLGETVFGPLFVVPAHEAVTGDLGEDAGGGNAVALGVALDDGGLGRGERWHGQTIHQRMRGGRGELGERGVHRAMGRLEDVDFVNDQRVNDPNAEMDFGFHVNGFEELLANFLGEFFGVIEASERFGQTGFHPLRWQHHGGGHHGASQWAAAGFVHAR